MNNFNEYFNNNTNNHICCFTRTDDGKDNRVFLPMLYSILQAGESAIIHDPNAMLYRKTSGIAKKMGYKLITLNFTDPNHSHCWNPLVDIIGQMNTGDIARAKETIKNIFLVLCQAQPGTQASYWTESARSLGEALTEFLLICADRDAINFREIYALLDKAEHKKFTKDETWKQLFRQTSSLMINKTISSYTNLSTDTLSHICTEAKRALEVFVQNKAYLNMFAQDDFSIEDCLEHKTLIYLVTPEERSTYHKLVALFIKQSYEVMTAYVQKTPYDRLKNRMNYVLKEFDTIPGIPDFAAMLSASRGRNIRFILDVQNLSTFNYTYQEQGPVILNKLSEIVYLFSREKDILEYVSFLCGRKEDGQAFAPADLQRLDAEEGEALWIDEHRKPCFTTLPSIEEYAFEILPEYPLPDTKEDYIGEFPSNKKGIYAWCLEHYERVGIRDGSDANKGWKYVVFQELVNEEWNILDINAMEEDKAEYAMEQIKKAIAAEMKIVKAGMEEKTYSIFELYSKEEDDQVYTLDPIKLDEWMQDCEEWMEEREYRDWITAFSNLLYFCIEYMALYFRPQYMDLYMVRKMIMAKRKDKRFFEDIVDHIENANDKERLSDLKRRYEYSYSGEEGRFLVRSKRYLEHFMEDHNEHDNTPSINAWAMKLSKDCVILTEYGRKNYE